MERNLRRGRDDIAAYDLIVREGWICNELDNDPWMPSGRTISRKRFQRLIALGLIEPQGDGLFPNSPAQTYRPTKKARNTTC